MWVFITAGRGPGECQIAVQRLMQILLAEAHAKAVDTVVLDEEPGEHGLMSVLIALDGAAAETLAASWNGTIQWICRSPLRPHWGRKNWFVAVSVIQPPPSMAAPRETDLRFATYRASGPGGQHVNKTDSAVRVTHLPTGLVAQAQDARSQHANKAQAVKRLTLLLANQQAAQRGNPVRVYRGADFVAR